MDRIDADNIARVMYGRMVGTASLDDVYCTLETIRRLADLCDSSVTGFDRPRFYETAGISPLGYLR